MANRFLSNIRINDAYTLPASDGTSGQVISTDGAGNLSFTDASTGGAPIMYRDDFAGDGSTVLFQLANPVSNIVQTQVYIDGTYQEKETYSVNGQDLTFLAAPPNGTSIEVISLTSINFAGDFVLDTLRFTGGTADQGTLSWNSEDETLDLIVSPNVTYQIGQELGHTVRNLSGVTLNNGAVVRVTGASGNKITVDLADNTAELGSSETFAVVTETISNNSTGKVTTEGLVRGLDTSAFAEGVAIWLGANGVFTDTKPQTPNHLVHIGWVVRSHATEGAILVKVSNGWEMEELHDVLITNVADKDMLVWNSTLGYWENSKTLGDITTGNITTSGTVDGVDISAFKADYDVHTHVEGDITDFGNYLTNITHDTVNNKLVVTTRDAATFDVDLSQYIDDTNLARLTSGSLDAGTGIATFTRDDATTFTVDFSALFDDTDTNDFLTGASFNTADGVLTLNVSNQSDVTVDLDGRYLESYTETDTLATVTSRGSSTTAGITVNGTITLPQNPVGTTYGNGVSTVPSYMIQQGAGDNDGIRLYAEAGVTNDVRFIFEVVDDIETGDTWVFRNKKTYTDYLANEVVKISGAGDITSSGFVSGTNLYSSNRLYISSSAPIIELRDTDSTGAAINSFISYKDSGNSERAWIGFGSAGNSVFGIQNTIGDIKLYTNTSVDGSLSVVGNILLTGDATTTNQDRTIDFTGFDKEGTTDFSDRAYIRHTINAGGHSGSVLEISSQNDANDGIAFTTHASSVLKHNGNDIITSATIGSQSVASAGNANTLDGIDSSQFLRSDATDTATGVLTFYTSGAPFHKWRNNNPSGYLLLGMYDDLDQQRVWFGMGGRTQTFNQYAAYSADGLSMNLDGAGAINISNRGSSKRINLNTGNEGDSAFTTLRILNQGVYVTPDSGNGSMHAPIFYDINNTAWYTNPADRSILNTLQLGGASSDTSNLKLDVQGNMAIRGGNGLYYGVTTNNYNSWTTRMYASSSTQYFNGQQFIFDNQGYGSTTFATINSQGVSANIFRDSADTNYYLDPASDSRLNNIVDARYNTFSAYRHSGSDFTSGTLVATDIPATATNGASFVIEVTGKSYSSTPPFSFMAQGYLYADTIINTSGVNNGDPRLAYIKVMELNGYLHFWWPRVSYWNSFEVRVRDAGGSPVNRATNITNNVDPSGATKKVQINLAMSTLYGYNTNAGDLYAQTYYDANDTSWYLNPNGVSRLGFATFEGDGNSYNSRTTTGVSIGRYAGSYAYIELGSTHASGGWIDFSKADGQDYAGRIRYWNSDERFVFDASGTASAYLSSAYFIHSGSVRAPIFYDENDTYYYVNPASDSRQNNITANRIGVNPSGSQSSRYGVSLYGGYNSGEPTYGLLFTGTSLGTHGAVTGNWATYFTMNDDSSRGWIFRRVGSGNCASISAGGHATFDGSVTTPFIDIDKTSQYGPGMDLTFSGTNSTGILIRNNTNTTTQAISFFYSSAPQGARGSITVSSTSTAYNTSSDYRLKENVIPMTGSLERVDQLKPTRFNFIGDDKTVDGFLAHEAAEVVPEAVTGIKDEVDEEGNPIYQGIDQAKLVPLLVGAIQELKAEVEALKQKLNGTN